VQRCDEPPRLTGCRPGAVYVSRSIGADSDVQRWLRQGGAGSIQHPGGTLYAHLCRVHDRLAELECGVDTPLAGLVHAVYGTDGFDVTLLDWNDRATLRNLIGDDAEALVYLSGDLRPGALNLISGCDTGGSARHVGGWSRWPIYGPCQVVA